MSRKKKQDDRLHVGDKVLVWRRTSDGERSPAVWLPGTVLFVPTDERFVTVEVELPPAAFRHKSMTVRETYWPEMVKKDCGAKK